MAENYLYQKVYELTISGTIHLMNPEPALEYCNEKLNNLLGAHNSSEERKVKLGILAEFTSIYEYDCVHAIRPKPITGVNTPEELERFIRLKQLVEDFYLYIGNIFCAYHIKLAERRQIPLLDFQPLIIDYNELYRRAVNEYFGALFGVEYPLQIFPTDNSQKEEMEYLRGHTVKYVEYRGVKVPALFSVTGKVPEYSAHAPGATYILPALIDHHLLMYLQNRLLSTGLKGITEKVRKGMELSRDERRLYDMFMGARRAGSALFSGSKERTMEELFHMFVRHDVIRNEKDLRNVLTGRGMTLGSVLHSNYAKQELQPEYYSLLNYLFGTKNLNIRNCIMHGNSVTYDYLAIGLTSVMLQLLWDIGKEDIFVQL